MMAGYLKDNPVKNDNDVNSIMREIMSVILEGALDGEPDDELGYSKYDYKKLDNKYPTISKSRRENWATLSTCFKYPEDVRDIICTTNTVEDFNRRLRKETKNKSVFSTYDSLFKMLYLAAMDLSETRQVTDRIGVK